MKKQKQRPARFIWKKGPVAKKILFSYLFVLLLPLILTLVVVVATLSRLQAQSAQHTLSDLAGHARHLLLARACGKGPADK